MRDMDGAAKVFGEGDVTIVVNMISNAARVYVGTKQIGLIQKLNLHLDMKQTTPQLEMEFPRTGDAQADLRIEESMREVKRLPWVRVTR